MSLHLMYCNRSLRLLLLARATLLSMSYFLDIYLHREFPESGWYANVVMAQVPNGWSVKVKIPIGLDIRFRAK